MIIRGGALLGKGDHIRRRLLKILADIGRLCAVVVGKTVGEGGNEGLIRLGLMSQLTLRL